MKTGLLGDSTTRVSPSSPLCLRESARLVLLNVLVASQRLFLEQCVAIRKSCRELGCFTCHGAVVAIRKS